jgi:hypothetical protein
MIQVINFGRFLIEMDIIKLLMEELEVKEKLLKKRRILQKY